MNLVLSSDFPSTINTELVALIRSLGSNLRVAWVAGSVGWMRFPRAKRAFRGIGITDLDRIDLGRDAGVGRGHLLDRYDIVYLTGGNPIRFREHLRGTSVDAQLREFAAADRLVVGASGGAMQLTANVSLFRLLSESVEHVVATRSECEGLGLVAFELLPHLNRHDDAFLENVRRYSELVPNDVIALADGAALMCGDDGVWRCSGTGTRFRRGVPSEIATS